jgi:hypothetical protein
MLTHKNCGICVALLGENLKKKTLKDKQIQFYQVRGVPMPLYGSKCWTVREREIQKLQIAEM